MPEIKTHIGGNVMLDGTYFFECQCGSDEHTMRFTLDVSEEDPTIYTSVFLNEWSFMKRIWIGIKYIFGYKCIYGHWDNWLMCDEDAKRLRDMCNNYLTRQKPNNS